jgi:iron(III) transport system ATP-binding protein
MRFEILELQRKIGVTTIYVTHDQEEAMVLSDEVLVMDLGKVIQRGGPEEIYFNPRNEFVADFIGKINFLKGSVKSREEGRAAVTIEDEGFQGEIRTTHADFPPGQAVLASIRPENIHLHTQKPEQQVNTWQAKLERKNFLGGLFDMEINISGKTLRCRSPFVVKADPGSDLYIHVKPEDVLLIEAD